MCWSFVYVSKYISSWTIIVKPLRKGRNYWSSCRVYLDSVYFHLPMNLWEGNVFSHVCLSMEGGHIWPSTMMYWTIVYRPPCLELTSNGNWSNRYGRCKRTVRILLEYFLVLQIVLHDPQQSPPVDSEGFVVSPGFESYVSISQIRNRDLPKPYEDSSCFEEKPKLNFFNTYSASECWRDCSATYVMEKCNCTLPGVTR